MESAAVAKSRCLLLAVALGAAPALLAWWLRPGLLQVGDVPGALAVAPLALLLARFLPVFPGARLDGSLTLAIAVVVLAGGAATLRLPSTVTNDERAILLQAEMFAAGQIAAPLGHRWYEDPVAHCPTHRRQVYEDRERGLRFSKYSPGPALALVPFVAFGVPALGPLLAALLDLLLLGRLARRFGLASPGWAPLLLATTPFFLLVQSSFQSEAFSLPAALLGFLLLLRLRDGDGRRWANGLGLGAAAGWIFLCRPLTGVVFALACAPGLLRRAPTRPAAGWGAVAWAVAGGLPFLAAALLYNYALTGSALLFPYQLYAREFGPWFPAGDPRAGQPLDVYGNGSLPDGLLELAARWSVAFFGLLGAIALGFWGLWRARRRDGGSGLLLASLLPCAYALHWYPGHWAYLGPLYCFESLGLLLVGALALLDDAPLRWQRALPLAAAIAGPLLFLLRFPLAVEQARERDRPQRAAAEAPAGAVVLLPRPPLAPDPGKLYTPTLPPFASGETVLLRELQSPAATLAALAELGLGGRPVFRFLPGDRPEFDELQPYQP